MSETCREPGGITFRRLLFFILVVSLCFVLLAYVLFDFDSTPSLHYLFVDGITGAPVSETLVYSRWCGRNLLGFLSGGDLEYGFRFTKTDAQGEMHMEGLIPRINCPGIKWLDHQWVYCFHPRYWPETLRIERASLGEDKLARTVRLQPVGTLVQTEQDAQRLLRSLQYALGKPHADSLFKRAIRCGVICHHDWVDMLYGWDAIFRRFPDSKVTRYTWAGYRRYLQESYVGSSDIGKQPMN